MSAYNLPPGTTLSDIDPQPTCEICGKQLKGDTAVRMGCCPQCEKDMDDED